MSLLVHEFLSPASACPNPSLVDGPKWNADHKFPAYLLDKFGDGSDGPVTVSSGTTTLTRDMYYSTLILDGGIIDTNGFKIFASESLKFTALAVAGSIRNNGLNGQDAVNNVGGAGRSSDKFGTLGGIASSPDGSTGTESVVNAGVPGTNVTKFRYMVGGAGGSGGQGGDSPFGPGASPGSVTSISPTLITKPTDNFIVTSSSTTNSPVLLMGGSPGSTGGTGASFIFPGEETGPGGGSGSSGQGGGVIYISARSIDLTEAVNTKLVQAKGGDGGNGGQGGTVGTSANPGGGGGSGGGGGGWVYLMYGSISNSYSDAIDVSGGDGGDGGSGLYGEGGDGGSGGYGGRCNVIDLSTGVITTTTGSSGSAGSAGTTPTGGTGGAGALCLVDL